MQPLLPPWATDDDIEAATDEILFDIRTYNEKISQFVGEYAPKLADEAEAYNKHAAEGW